VLAQENPYDSAGGHHVQNCGNAHLKDQVDQRLDSDCGQLSYRDVENLLAERGLDISYETIRSWVLKFGPTIARRLRRRRPWPSDRWHLDEMVVPIAGQRMYLWRAVDHEGEVLECA
jgi:transposase-like protein